MKQLKCVITQYCGLARHMSSRGPVVEHPTSVRKVIGSIPIWSSDYIKAKCILDKLLAKKKN